MSSPSPDLAAKSDGLFGRDISPERFRSWLLYLFLLGLIVRTGFLLEHAHSPSFGVPTLDQKYYDMAARMIDSGRDLHLLRGLRPLLYPMFLAAIYKVGGAHGVDLAIVTQHLLGIFTGILVALIGVRVFRNRVCGLIGGALYVLAPVPLYFEGELLIESSYIFLIFLGVLLVIKTAESERPHVWWLWILCGAVTVLTAQARPNILVFMAVYPALAAWRWWYARRLATLVPLWALAGGVLMGIPWAFLNKMQSDHLQAIPSAGGVNLYLGNKRKADGMTVELNRRVDYSEEYEDSVEVWAREEYAAAMKAAGRQPDSDPMAISKYWTHQAILEIKADPAHWLHLMAKKTWLIFWNAEVPNNKAFAFLQTEFAWLRWLPVRWVVLLMLAPAGIWAAIRLGRCEPLLVVLIYLALYGAADIGFFICDRYRYPLWPAMAVLGGGGLAWFMESLRQQQWKRCAGLVASAACMAAISLPNWFHAQLPTFARDYLFRSVASFEKGRFPEALADLDKSIALDPTDATALHERGNVLLAMDRLPEARKQLEQALQLDPQDANVWNNYGITLDRLQQTNLAMQAFQRGIDCNPPSQHAYLSLAIDQIRLGQFESASNTLGMFEKQAREPSALELALRSVVSRHFGRASEADSFQQKASQLDAAAAQWAITNAVWKN